MGLDSVRPRAMGWAIKTHRTRPDVDLTQAALAEKTQIKYMRIANIEAGRVPATDGELKAIGKALRVKPVELVALAKAGRPTVGGGQ